MSGIDFYHLNQMFKTKRDVLANHLYEMGKKLELFGEYVSLYYNDWDDVYSLWYETQRMSHYHKKEEIEELEKELKEIYFKKEPEFAKKVYAEIFNLQEKGDK